MKSSERSQVLVVGSKEIAPEPFTQRGLRLQKVDYADLSHAMLLNQSCAVLVAELPGKYRLIRSFFSEHFKTVCQFGLMTGILTQAQDATQIAGIRDSAYRRLGCLANSERGAGLTPNSASVHPSDWVYEAEEEWRLAQKFVGHDPGPPLGEALIEDVDVSPPLDQECCFLLRRAFSDSRRIRVERLSGGKSAKETLRVFANLAGFEAGSQPMPFFVKFGLPSKMNDERRNYSERAEPFIPFHLRPALNQRRSVGTLTASALVCDFVEGAVSLRKALRSGHGAGAIFSLFEGTLRGLRAHMLRRPKEENVLTTFIEDRVKAREIKQYWPSRIRDAKSFGATRSPVELEEILKSLAQGLSVSWGICHGDLHDGNVMIRNRDAVVIDFGSMSQCGPLSVDPAFLEVSLAFGTDNRDKPAHFEHWRQFVDELFDDPAAPPISSGVHHRFGWLETALRELRHVIACCGVSRLEAKIMLCACLVRYARLTPFALKTSELMDLAEKRRAYALVVADRLCSKITRSGNGES